MRAVASSQAFLKGSSMENVRAVAGWSSPSTFIKFYSLDVRMATGSRVLSAWADAFLGLQLSKVRQALWYSVPKAMTSSQHWIEPMKGNIPVTYVTLVSSIWNEIMRCGPFHTLIALPSSYMEIWWNSVRHADIAYGTYAWGAELSAIWPMNLVWWYKAVLLKVRTPVRIRTWREFYPDPPPFRISRALIIIPTLINAC